MSVDLSFKCRMYGEMEHAPCSGTTDDGREAPCQCWCHSSSEDDELAEAVARAWMFGDTE